MDVVGSFAKRMLCAPMCCKDNFLLTVQSLFLTLKGSMYFIGNADFYLVDAYHTFGNQMVIKYNET